MIKFVHKGTMSKQSNEVAASMNALAARSTVDVEVKQKVYNEQEVAASFKVINDEALAQKKLKEQRDAELSKIPVSSEDVALVAHQLDVSEAQAKRFLQEHNGDVTRTLADILGLTA